MGRRGRPGGDRAPGARAARLRLPPLELGSRRGRRPRLVRASEAASAEVKATLADMRARRKAAQPSGIKTFGSTFKNPDDPRAAGRTAGQLLDAAGCRGLRSAAPGSRTSTRTSSRTTGSATTADVVAVMAEGRRRVTERFGIELEPEVQALGAGGVSRRLGARRDAVTRPSWGCAVNAVRRLRVARRGRCCSAVAWLWLRDSSLVAVTRVSIVGRQRPRRRPDPLGADAWRRAT